MEIKPFTIDFPVIQCWLLPDGKPVLALDRGAINHQPTTYFAHNQGRPLNRLPVARAANLHLLTCHPKEAMRRAVTWAINRVNAPIRLNGSRESA